ncbi:MAG: hypothetical protein QME58_13870 [Bacteroidota bacterium]|nr:hypothetical protein [Bacteroidota bacterium]
MSDKDVILKLVIDPSGAIKAIQQVEGSVNNLGKELTNVKQPADALTGAFVNIAARAASAFAVFRGLKATFGEYISAYNESEKAIASLTQALKQQGLFTQSTLTDMQAYASELQNLTGFNDDATIQTMAQLTAMGLQGEQLKKATALSQDLATVMGTNMDGAARIMADAFSGNAGMLKRYIKGLDEIDIKQRGAISIIEQLTKAVGGQAEAVGNTGYGSVKKFSEIWGDLKEKWGEILTNVLAPLLKALSSLIKLIIDAPPFVHALTLGVVALAGAFALLNTSMGGLPLIIGAIVTGIGMFGAWAGTMKKAKQTTRSASDEIQVLKDRIKNLKVEAGQTKELDELQRKLDALGKPTEFTLRNEIAKSQEAVDEYTSKLEDGKIVLSQILELEKQGKDVRTENPELAEKYFQIFNDGNKEALLQLTEYENAGIAAAKPARSPITPPPRAIIRAFRSALSLRSLSSSCSLVFLVLLFSPAGTERRCASILFDRSVLRKSSP